jgi:hypothetical protein
MSVITQAADGIQYNYTAQLYGYLYMYDILYIPQRWAIHSQEFSSYIRYVNFWLCTHVPVYISQAHHAGSQDA